MSFVRIPAGTFMMGSADFETKERPVHQVTLTRNFWMGKFEVTQQEFEVVAGYNPSHHAGLPTHPVENLSWLQAFAYTNALSAREGLPSCYDPSGNPLGGSIYDCGGYRLVTEAEWEYAVRAGTTTEYFFGTFGVDDALLDQYAWYALNSGLVTHPVGQKAPNPWGLYDVYGNIWEWVHDAFAPYPSTPVTDPQGPSRPAGLSVQRGGNMNDYPAYLRSAVRLENSETFVRGNRGFRVARTAFFVDLDSDGIEDGLDLCTDTVPDEMEPAASRYVWTGLEGLLFTPGPTKGKGRSSQEAYSLQDTRGCSCTQVGAGLGLKWKAYSKGCSSDQLDAFIASFGSAGKGAVKMAEVVEQPAAFELEANYPNPFNPSTRIRFTVPEATESRLVVYDVMGREVRTLINGPIAAGPHEVTFDAAGLPSGVYLYTLTAGGEFRTRRMILLK